MLREFCEKVNNVLDRLRINRIISHNFIARYLAVLKLCWGVGRVEGADVLFIRHYLRPLVSRPIESFRSFDDSLLLSATLICPNLPVKFRPARFF